MSRTICILAIILLSFAFHGKAANDNFPFGGRQAGMGNAGVSLYDFWGISHNQAGMARQQNPAAGFYFENRFLAREMSLGAGAFMMPAASGVVGLSLTYFGYAMYNESKIGLAYAHAFSEKLSAGVQLNYLNTSIGEGYGSAGNFAVEMGLIYELLPQLNVGAHLFNPTKARVKSNDGYGEEYIPTILRFGFSYAFSERVLLSLETEKDIERDPVFKAGIEYQLADMFFVRAGLGSRPTQNTFGFGMYTGRFRIDLSSSFHHILGYSPQASILVDF
jgi:hypothetical protein